jgi:hypothetical protein
MVTFEEEDRRYLEWIHANPHGWVLNYERKPTARYLKLHRASCSTISGEPPRGERWTFDYAKRCADTDAELRRWTFREFGVDPDVCSHCNK